ncbi:seizure 6-like protein [Osmerus eperlanus]|uniref:seizure 6-like protein n=1 Tax=Osmerus eperlanus TaxID=29151 RepID=UPI002E11E9A9
MRPAARSGRYPILNTLSAVLFAGVLWTCVAVEGQGEVVPTPPTSSASPAATEGDGDDGGPPGRGADRAAGGLLAQKDRLLSQTAGGALPSSLPQDMLPLLGRGLTVGSLPGGRSLEEQGGGLLKKFRAPAPVQASDAPLLLPTYTLSPTPNQPEPQSGTYTLQASDEVTAVAKTTVDPDIEGDLETETLSPAVSGCMVNFSDPEGYIDSSDDPPLPDGTFLHCTYTVTVYTGYGVELQVKSVNLSEGEQLSIRGVDESGSLLVLANQTLLVEGQVIRSPTNTISVYYRSSPEGGMGMFQLHYQSELNISDSDMLTILDGDEVTTRILGQYVGGAGPFKMSSTTPDLTVTFHSDPAGLVFGKGEGFIINYMEVSRNDSCPDLPEIQNGWKTTSHAALVRGARITYQCDPGYDLVGRETLACQLDLSWSTQPPFCEKIMYCSDPGHVEHSTRSLSDPKLLVGTTIQYSCVPGYVLQGGATLTCYGREPGTPVWTSKLPHCASEDSVSCENPGLPDNGYQILSKRLYLPGESLTFVCYKGYELIGEVAIKCITGNPSYWSGPLPLCSATHDCFGNHALEVAEVEAGSRLDGGNMALAIFILVLLLSVLLGGAYVYVTRCRYHSNLRLPLIYPHPYSQITVETEFDNPLYETGGQDTREYEVSI